MGLESGTFIEDLVPSNPLGTDSKSQGDNHIRLVKNVLQNQFPSLGAEAVNATAAEINKVQTALVPEGAITMFAGTTLQVPTGWQLCNGTGTTNNLSIAVPNLESRFVVGSVTDVGGSFDIGETGGSSDLVISDTTDGHAITEAEMPSHSHGIAGNNVTGANGTTVIIDGSGTSKTQQTSSVGGGQAHSHDINITEANANLPPYYALAYIIFLG